MRFDKDNFKQFLTISARLSKNTVRTYTIRAGVIVRELGEDELTKQWVENFLYKLAQKGRKNSSINTYVQTLGHLDKYCKDRALPHGFMDGIRNLPKEDSEIIILSPEEIALLLSTHIDYKNNHWNGLDNKNLTLTAFLYITGCRLEEASSLIVKRLDIENENAYLVDTKNKQNRYLYFEGPIKDQLRELIKGKKENELVFTSSKGTKVLDGVFNENLRRRAAKAGIKKYIHAHALRHSFATHLIERGVDLYYVSKLLGHKDVKTTERYLHVADKTLQIASHRLPILQKYSDPQERLRDIRESIEKTKIMEDERFSYSLTEGNGKLTLDVSIK